MKRSNLAFILGFSLICLIAAYLRVFQIETRPLHSDESVNYLFVQQINRDGFFTYSHENYHGPLFFYISTFLVNVLGDSVFSLRASAIFTGIFSIIFLFGFLPSLKKSFVLFSALLICFSPSLIFFSRYAIHENFLILGSLIFAFSIYNWHQDRKPLWFYWGALGLTILITTKETFIITLFSLFLSFLILGDYKKVWLSLKEQYEHILFALLLAIILISGTYTAGFNWLQGFEEFFKSFPQWFARNHSDTGHHKRFEYYLVDVINNTEPYLILSSILFIALFSLSSLLKILKSPYQKFLNQIHEKELLFFFVWMLSAFLVYSYVKYKTVWLVINITFPALLFLAKLLSILWETKNINKLIPSGILLLILFTQIKYTLKYNFAEAPLPYFKYQLSDSIPYGPNNPFSYVHTAKGSLDLVADMLAYLEKKPNAKMLMGIDGYFPLPFYLRAWQGRIAYTTNYNLTEALGYYDILVLDFYKQNLDIPEFEKKYYRLSDYKESFTYFRK